MEKYNLKAICNHCAQEFITKPRFVLYCSTSCKNPINRQGHVPWNKGLTMSEEQKTKMNMDGLQKGRGHNKGKPNPIARKRFLENNPNRDGRINNRRPKKLISDPFKLYKIECRKATYRTIYKLKKEGKCPKIGKYKTDLQIDHIIPYKQGFELGIDPKIIGSIQNIQFILGSENRKKWDSYQTEDIINRIMENKNNGIW